MENPRLPRFLAWESPSHLNLKKIGLNSGGRAGQVKAAPAHPVSMLKLQHNFFDKKAKPRYNFTQVTRKLLCF